MSSARSILGGRIEASSPDAMSRWYQHTIDESDLAALGDHRDHAAEAVGQTVQELLAQWGGAGAEMAIDGAGHFDLWWEDAKPVEGVAALLATYAAARCHRFKGWMHAVGEGGSVSLVVRDGDTEVRALDAAPGITAAQLVHLDVAARADTAATVEWVNRALATHMAEEGSTAPDSGWVLFDQQHPPPDSLGAPQRVTDCIAGGGAALPLDGEHRYGWLLLGFVVGGQRAPRFLGEGEELEIDVEPVMPDAGLAQIDARLFIGGRFDVVSIDLETAQRTTVIEAASPPGGMRLAATAAGLAIGTGQGLVFADPETAETRFRFGRNAILNLFTADDGTLLFATHMNGTDAFTCSAAAVTHLGFLDMGRIMNLWRDGDRLCAEIMVSDERGHSLAIRTIDLP